jgi:hypothetical protein
MSGARQVVRKQATRWVATALLVFLSACGESEAPSPIEGEWIGTNVVAVTFDFRLSEAAGRLTGSGHYYLGGASKGEGTFWIEGAFNDPEVSWTLAYDSGLNTAFVGSLTDGSTIEGTESYVDVHGQPRSYTITYRRKEPVPVQ